MNFGIERNYLFKKICLRIYCIEDCFYLGGVKGYIFDFESVEVFVDFMFFMGLRNAFVFRRGVLGV